MLLARLEHGTIFLFLECLNGFAAKMCNLDICPLKMITTSKFKAEFLPNWKKLVIITGERDHFWLYKFKKQYTVYFFRGL